MRPGRSCFGPQPAAAGQGTDVLIDMGRIGEHLEVVGADGQHLGTVDALDIAGLKLTKSGPASGRGHRYIPHGAIASVGDRKVRLSILAAETCGMTGSRGAGPIG
jgi:hypothetical protein